MSVHIKSGGHPAHGADAKQQQAFFVKTLWSVQDVKNVTKVSNVIYLIKPAFKSTRFAQPCTHWKNKYFPSSLKKKG